MIDITIHKSIRNAIKRGDLDAVSQLINDDRSRLTWVVEPFGSWLDIAATYGEVKIVEWLVHQGMDVNQQSGVFESGPLQTAASFGHANVVSYLLENGATFDVSEPTRNPLFGAISGGHTEVATLLIDNGIDISVKYTGESMTNMDALAFAREWGSSDIVALLEAAQAKNSAAG